MEPCETTQVTLSVFRDELTEQWFIEKVVFKRDNLQHQARFQTPVTLDKGLSREFHDALTDILPQSFDFQVYTDPSRVIQLPDLILGGVRILTQKLWNGTQSVTIRFARALGALQSLLSAPYRTEHHTLQSLETSAAEALQSLLQPCLSLLAVDRPLVTSESVSQQVAARLDSLDALREEMQFFSLLLQRFVENSSRREEQHLASGRMARLRPLAGLATARSPGRLSGT